MKTISGIVAIAIIGMTAFLSYQHLDTQSAHAQALATTNSLVKDKSKTTANLGGMKASIPKYFAQFFETVPQKTGQTETPIINSFGFYVRFPDMAGLSTPALEKEKEAASIDTTKWIFVGIDAGAHSGDSLFLERMSNNVNGVGTIRFKRKSNDEFGLASYTPIAIDPATRQAFTHMSGDVDIFIDRDKSDKVQTYIECSNVMHEAAPCSQHFFLPAPIKASVEVSYRRGLLKDWREIKSSVTNLILSFGDTSKLPSRK